MILDRVKNQFLLSFFLLFFGVCGFTQNNKITGFVAGLDLIALEGATVSNKNRNLVTITGVDGSYSIEGSKGDQLEFSFVGYRSKQVKVGDVSVINVSIEKLIVNLDEVLITGYTSQRIKEISGSVAVVRPKDLVAVPAGQVEQMLQGRVAGLNVITSGAPGSTPNVRLHGIGNFGDVTPLYIIDGVQGNVNNLNPNDIESLQVLKDAGAYAIYGVRGANGVIIITTRNGKGRTSINYDVYLNSTRPLKRGLDLLTPTGMAELTALAYENSNQPLNDPLFGSGTPRLPGFFIAGENYALPPGDPSADPSTYNIDFTSPLPIHQIVRANHVGTDWFHEFFKPAFTQSHTLTFSGSSEKNKYLLSLGYLDQQGTAISTFLKRYTLRINTEFSPRQNIRVGENLQWAGRENP